MIRRGLLVGIAFCLFLIDSFGQDLPPATSDFQTIPAGSYVIPLDAEKQSINQIDQFTGTSFLGFNLAAYGLAYRLLDQGIPVKWVIRAGKGKDEVDFTIAARKRYPDQGSFTTESFISSAFVIDVNDVLRETCNGPSNSFTVVDDAIAAFGNGVAVYELRDDENLDVRYQLTYPPTIAVLNDEGWAEAHYNILNDAGIPYTVIGSASFFQDFSCFTFISQPHLEVIDNPNYIPSLQTFLANGGNFLAQCSATEVFEDPGSFLSTNGFSANWGACGENLSYSYFNPDMPVMQFQGELPIDIFGTISSYDLQFGSTWRPNSYFGVENQVGKWLITAGDVNGSTAGGNIFYMGGHEFSSSFIGFCEGGFITPAIHRQINQLRRTYLNTLFIPTSISFACAGNDVCYCPGSLEGVELGCDNLSTDPGVTYSWSPPDGLSCTDCPHPIATPTSTTTYTLTVSSALGNSCTDPSSVTITVLDEIEAVNVQTNCNADNSSYTVSFDITGGNSQSLSVEGVNGTLTGTSFVSEPIPSGDAYSFQIYDANGCSASLDGSFFCCAATAQISGGGEICSFDPEPLTIQIDLEGEPDWNLVYAIDGVPQPPVLVTESPYTFETQIGGTYTIVSVTDIVCEGNGSGSAQIVLLDLPDPVDLGVDTSFCEGEALVLDASQSSATFLWQDGSESPTYTVANSGNYAVTVTNICGSVSDDINVDVKSLPISARLGNDTTICLTDVLTLNVDQPNASFIWQDGSTLPFYTVREAGAYSVTVSNECGAETDQIQVDYFNCTECFVAVPNAFTPNYDGINDFFKADHSGCVFLDFELKVFDRWGGLRFETTSPDEGWSGFQNDRSIPIGVYVWLLNYTYDFKGEIIQQQLAGDVTILR